MMFRIDGPRGGRFSHCGVLEFVAEPGVVYLPGWVRVVAAARFGLSSLDERLHSLVSQMMRNLLLSEGDTIEVSNANLQVVRRVCGLVSLRRQAPAFSVFP